jgi:hypothetical protein
MARAPPGPIRYKENDITVTDRFLLRAAAVAAAAAGLIFIGVQINHPSLDATSISTTDVMIRNSLKLLMAALALAGITGVYLFQVAKVGVLGLVGYIVFAAGYLGIFGPSTWRRWCSRPSPAARPPM